MSTENKPADAGSAAPNAAEEIKNLKAEFQRKTDNLAETNKQLQAQLAQLVNQTKPAPTTPTKKVSVFDDEDAYAERIASETEARIQRQLQAQQEKAVRLQSMSMQLVSEYPELNDKNSELMKKANAIFNDMPETERSHPMAMKTAVYDAAQELDLKPFNKRVQKQNDDDSFQIGSGSGASSTNKKQGKGDLTPEQETLAQLLGIDVSKPEVRARIKEKHGRSSYGRYK